MKNNLHNIYNLLGEINKRAYNNKYLIANKVLSKSYDWESVNYNYESNFINIFKLISYLIIFYYRHSIYFFEFIFKKFAFILSKFKFKNVETFNDVILIDTYFIVNKIILEKEFNDSYFPGLSESLKDNNKKYIYIPKIYGDLNPIQSYHFFKILKEKKYDVLTEFQLVNLYDILKIIFFIIIYPVYVLKTAFSIKKNTREAIIVKKAIINSLRNDALTSYIRYIFGFRLSKLPLSNVKCISWYENQCLDKCLYKGLRSNGKSIMIYGSQLFVKPIGGLLNLDPDEKEIQKGVLPDIVLSNGPYYIPKKTLLNYRVGPSLRYQKIFNNLPNPKKDGIILVLLPYYISEIKKILDLLFDINRSYRKRIIIKFHPTTNVKDFNIYLDKFKITDSDLYDLFKKTSIVIGSGTGSLTEAITQGIPVIQLSSIENLKLNYLSEKGRGFIWDVAISQNEIERHICKMMNNIEFKKKEIVEYAFEYRKLFFNEIGNKNLLEYFDI